MISCELESSLHGLETFEYDTLKEARLDFVRLLRLAKKEQAKDGFVRTVRLCVELAEIF